MNSSTLAIVFIIVILLVFLYMGFLIFRDIRLSKIRDKKLEETKEYLETIRKRIELSNSKDALILLWKEMKIKSETLTFNNSTNIDWIKYTWYLVGKAEGIKSTKIK